MTHRLRTFALTSAAAYVASTAVIYWWLITGPWPEDAWP